MVPQVKPHEREIGLPAYCLNGVLRATLPKRLG